MKMKVSHCVIGLLWLALTVAIIMATIENPVKSCPVVVTGIESGISPPEHSKFVNTEGGIPGAWIQTTRAGDGKLHEFYVNPFRAKQYHMNDTLRYENTGMSVVSSIGGVFLITIIALFSLV